MKSYFIAHGAPDIIFEKSEYTEILRKIGEENSDAKGIIIFSAHYESPTQKIGAIEKYTTIYDFYGFDKELYEVKTNYFSDEILATKVKKILDENGIESILDYKRGIDHGAWTVLKLINENLNIPVISMSLNIALAPDIQYSIGKSLQSFKDENILIIGSGGIVHNLSLVDFYAEKNENWALEFQNWIREKVENWDTKEILNYSSRAPHSKLAVPRSEHFTPFLIALGSGDSKKNAQYLAQDMKYGNLGLDIIQFD